MKLTYIFCFFSFTLNLVGNDSVYVWGSLNANRVIEPSLFEGRIKDVKSQALLKEDGSVVTWGTNIEGDSSAVASQLMDGVISIHCTDSAYAALKNDGSVVTWGSSFYGGDSSSVVSELSSGVTEVFSTDYHFAALKEDGSVVTWGSGVDSSAVASQLQEGVEHIYSNVLAFAALKNDGSVVTWGSGFFGGDSSAVTSELSSGVTEVFSTWSAFAALKEDGSVVTWGDLRRGGDFSIWGNPNGSDSYISSVASESISEVTTVFSTNGAFAALKENGSVIAWGDGQSGGNTGAILIDTTALDSPPWIDYIFDTSSASGLLNGVKEIFANSTAFAALKEDGSVVTWGNSGHGGDSSSIASELSSGVSTIYSTGSAFAALKEDGSVVTWGNSDSGGDSSSVASELSSGVTEVYSTSYAFAALKQDGSVVAWGDDRYGGDVTLIPDGFTSELSQIGNIFSSSRAFFAVKSDSDGDGVDDYLDDFPDDPNEQSDTDGDGVGDNTDDFPNNPNEQSDTDGDGVGDNTDDFPNNSNEQSDSDGDGVGDNTDLYYGYNDTFMNEFLSIYNFYSLDEIQDLRPGSIMIEVSGSQATVQLQMEESSDLETWTEAGTPATMTISVDTDTKFFRFKMAE